MARLVPNALTKTVAIAALAWFVAGGVGAVMALGATKSGTSLVVSVDRTGKGDRLPSVVVSKPRVNAPSSVASIALVTAARLRLGFQQDCRAASGPYIRTLRRLSGAREAGIS